MNLLLILVLFVFIIGILIPLRISNSKQLLRVPVFTSAIVFLQSLLIAFKTIKYGAFTTYHGNFLFDSLSIYHILLVNFIFLITSIYSIGYFENHIKLHGDFDLKFIRRYIILWQVFQLFLLIVLISNNIGFMWVALETTTLVSTFLIISPSNPLSVEAMWKYLIVCSVGIAFAFIGTILTIAAAKNNITEPLFLFSELTKNATLIHPQLMLLAFIFIVIGFGTKAGLSPMHTWLPDAHSQAPTPVSAVFSGVMLNCALFGIMRYMPITEKALGGGFQAHSIVLFLGITSLIFAVIFIPIQHDIKRLLAYCSIEHIGIIAIGLGIGGLGTFAALLHITNHSLSKVLAFFSAGHISENYGTRDMRKIKAAIHNIPIWGNTFFIAMLVLIGVAPFAIFLSEFLILKEAFFTGKYIIVAIIIFVTISIFISILKNSLDVSYGKSINKIKNLIKPRKTDIFIVSLCLILLLVLGVWIPTPFSNFLKDMVNIVEKGVML